MLTRCKTTSELLFANIAYYTVITYYKTSVVPYQHLVHLEKTFLPEAFFCLFSEKLRYDLVQSKICEAAQSHSMTEAIRTVRETDTKKQFTAVILDHYFGTNFVMLFLSPDFCCPHEAVLWCLLVS